MLKISHVWQNSDALNVFLSFSIKQAFYLKNKLEKYHVTTNIRTTASERISNKEMFCSMALDGLDKYNMVTTFVLSKPSWLEKNKSFFGQIF